jgi:D-glycero-D-manno-heptose 1,7-bisphosphate phosphatase
MMRHQQAVRRAGKGLHPAVFIDKDGTLVENLPYNVDPALMRLAPGAGESLMVLQEAGFLLFVVSNQSGVARGLFPESALVPVWERLRGLLASYGVTLAGIYYCPHHPDGSVPGYRSSCPCRKPAPGMLLLAAEEHAIDLGTSWMVGDILDDVEAGHQAGCSTILIDNGNETEWVMSPVRTPQVIALDLGEAARVILAAAESSPETDHQRQSYVHHRHQGERR